MRRTEYNALNALKHRYEAGFWTLWVCTKALKEKLSVTVWPGTLKLPMHAQSIWRLDWVWVSLWLYSKEEQRDVKAVRWQRERTGWRKLSWTEHSLRLVYDWCARGERAWVMLKWRGLVCCCCSVIQKLVQTTRGDMVILAKKGVRALWHFWWLWRWTCDGKFPRSRHSWHRVVL